MGKAILVSNKPIKRFNQNQTDELANILRNNGVISVPTDTVYGVCAQISSKQAYNNLVAVKQRPPDKPFPIMCADEDQIRSIAIVDKVAEKLIKTFMPGPITLILNKKIGLPEYINNGKSTVAVRMATSKTLEELIRKTGSPIFMSSANKSGEPTCTSLDEIEEACPTINGMLEGNISFGQGSTIVDCSSKNIRIIREGPITMEDIKKGGFC